MGFWPTVSEILALTEVGEQSGSWSNAKVEAEKQWGAAIAALGELLGSTPPPESRFPGGHQGIILAGPAPILSDPSLTGGLSIWTFTAAPLQQVSFQLLPARTRVGIHPLPVWMQSIPLLSADPLAREQFCLVLTAGFGLVMALGQPDFHPPCFQFSFAPEVVQRAWAVLRPRVLLTRPPQLEQLDQLISQFPPQTPPYKILEKFSRLLLKILTQAPEVADPVGPPAHLSDPQFCAKAGWFPQGSPQPWGSTHAAQPAQQPPRTLPSSGFRATSSPLQQTVLSKAALSTGEPHPDPNRQEIRQSSDIELLQAIAHEVRTPLTTISTLTQLLLKRADLPPEVVKRLEAIQRECLEQIDRFSLIFRAVELETSSQRRSPLHLSQISLRELFQENISRWQKQAARRNLTLEVSLPQRLPAVISDPTLLDQVLTGLMEHLSQSLPSGSHMQLEVTLAGEQLKLQLRSHPAVHANPQPDTHRPPPPPLKSVGHLLMLQPETGNLSLSLPVTKNLFQALGGKLTVRKCPQQGEVLTIFLPLGPETHPM